MSLDQRQCPVCKKAPPQRQEWRDYDAHVRACALAFYEKEKNQDAVLKEYFEKLMRDFIGGPA